MGIMIIVSLQILFAGPFLLGETTPYDYLVRSKLLGHARNGAGWSPQEYDHLAAVKGLSVFWTFLPDEYYYDYKWGLTLWSKIGIPALNFIFFFVKNNALWDCLINLDAFLKMKPDQPIKLVAKQR